MGTRVMSEEVAENWLLQQGPDREDPSDSC